VPVRLFPRFVGIFPLSWDGGTTLVSCESGAWHRMPACSHGPRDSLQIPIEAAITSSQMIAIRRAVRPRSALLGPVGVGDLGSRGSEGMSLALDHESIERTRA